MTVSKTQLIGGSFQDSEGNLLVNGYLKFKLSQDSSVTGVGNICSGIEITIALDSNANVASSSSTPAAPNQYIWANDVLATVNTFYRVTGYTATGQPAWGPNNQQVSSGGVGGGTFDLGTWVPNQVISWTPPPSGILLENNGTDNSSQTVLNLESSDSSISIVDAGGGTLDFTVGGVLPDFMFGIGNFCPLAGIGVTQGSVGNDVALRVYAQRFSTPTGFSFSKLSFTASCNLGGGGFVNIALYDDSGTRLAQTGAVAIGNFTELNIDMDLSPAWAGPAGNYYIAWTTTDINNTTMWGWDFGSFLLDSGTSSRNLLNRDSVVNFGYSPNAATSGAADMPASLGSLTASGSGNSTGSPALLFQK